MVGAAAPRWVGTGRTVYDNKGRAARQYEPFLSSTHLFEMEAEVIATGVSPVLMYDPAGRQVAVLRPDHAFEKIVFDGWRQESWDANDTLLITDPRTDAHVGSYFQRRPAPQFLPSWLTARAGGGLGPEEQAAAQSATTPRAEPPIPATGKPGVPRRSSMPCAAPPPCCCASRRRRPRSSLEPPCTERARRVPRPGISAERFIRLRTNPASLRTRHSISKGTCSLVRSASRSLTTARWTGTGQFPGGRHLHEPYALRCRKPAGPDDPTA